jgi:hypothetical protein
VRVIIGLRNGRRVYVGEDADYIDEKAVLSAVPMRKKLT